MEVTSSDSLPDQNHPNYKRWKKGRELSIYRGKFVSAIINQHISASGLCILDIGSGEGGTSFILSESENNFVISADFSITRLYRQKQNFDVLKFQRINCNGKKLPFAYDSFDVIILQDVIEHVDETEILVDDIYKILKPGGIIYISTPNRFSIFNIVSDPHWGLPLLALLKREGIRKYYLKYFRKSEINRVDLAELFSAKQLHKLLKNKFDIHLYTKYSVNELLNGNKGIVWSGFHLKLISIIKFLRLNKILLAIANDCFGFINNYFTPTFYMVVKKNNHYVPE